MDLFSHLSQLNDGRKSPFSVLPFRPPNLNCFMSANIWPDLAYVLLDFIILHSILTFTARDRVTITPSPWLVDSTFFENKKRKGNSLYTMSFWIEGWQHGETWEFKMGHKTVQPFRREVRDAPAELRKIDDWCLSSCENSFSHQMHYICWNVAPGYREAHQISAPLRQVSDWLYATNHGTGGGNFLCNPVL